MGGHVAVGLRRRLQLGGIPQPDIDAVLVQPLVELLGGIGRPSAQQSGQQVNSQY